MSVKNQLHIYVMEAGFVLIGRARPYRGGDDISLLVLDDVAVIRRWGTDRGIGQLALTGPTPITMIDPEPDGVEITRRAIYRKIPCTFTGSKTWKPTT